jgi:hypothetical protein
MQHLGTSPLVIALGDALAALLLAHGVENAQRGVRSVRTPTTNNIVRIFRCSRAHYG